VVLFVSPSVCLSHVCGIKMAKRRINRTKPRRYTNLSDANDVGLLCGHPQQGCEVKMIVVAL